MYYLTFLIEHAYTVRAFNFYQQICLVFESAKWMVSISNVITIGTSATYPFCQTVFYTLLMINLFYEYIILYYYRYLPTLYTYYIGTDKC